MGINEQLDYASVFGEDPAYVHLEDGKRAAFARGLAQICTDLMTSDAMEREELGVGETKPVCPGCAVTVSFNLLCTLGQQNDYSPAQIAAAMLRLWGEVLDRNEFFTSERSGIRQED